MEIKFKENGYVNNTSEVINELHNKVHMSNYENVKYDNIINFLNNPEDEVNYFALFREFLNFQFQNEDLLEYINIKGKNKYTKVITINIDEVKLEQWGDNVVLYQVGIAFACDDSFVLEDRNYTMNELKELVNKKILYPIINRRIKISSIDELTNIKVIKVYQEKLDSFNYLYSLSNFNYLIDSFHKNEEWKNKVEYYEFFIRKLKQIVDVDTLMLIVKRKIESLYVDDLINYYHYGTSGSMLEYYANDIKKIKILVRKYNDYAQKNGLELISENEFDIFLEGYKNNSADTYCYLSSFNQFLYSIDLNYDEILKIKKECESNEEWMYWINDNHFNPQNFVDKLILSKTDEHTALKCLIDFKGELDFLTKCKLLRVILNSGNKEVIDSVIADGLLSESNVKKYINKRK